MDDAKIQITKSHRRTISLEILPDATIHVKAPWFLPRFKIQEFVDQHERWIKKRQEAIKKIAHTLGPKKFQTGETLLYLGKRYPLLVSKTVAQSFRFENEHFSLNEFNQKNAQTYITNWYKKQALELFTTRVANYAAQIKVTYTNIALSSANSKWGSCSHDNKLMFNWRLIMAPMEVIDSVIFHELGHILEKNHTKKFWRKVTMWYPSYGEQKKWLDENGQTLTL